jgi:hypothetical protein
VTLQNRRLSFQIAALFTICSFTCEQPVFAQEPPPQLDKNSLGTHLAGERGAFTITGNIVDETGAVVPIARVVITNLSTNSTFETTTDSQGHFVVTAVSPGRYHIRGVVPGFAVKDKEMEVSPNSLNAVTLTGDRVVQSSDPTVKTSPARSAAQSVERDDCNRYLSDKTPDFRIAKRYRTDLKPGIVLQLSLAPSDATRDKLLTLACKLGRKYADNQDVYIWFMDSYRAAKLYNPQGEGNDSEAARSRRGYYALLKDTKEESLAWLIHQR